MPRIQFYVSQDILTFLDQEVDPKAKICRNRATKIRLLLNKSVNEIKEQKKQDPNFELVDYIANNTTEKPQEKTL